MTSPGLAYLHADEAVVPRSRQGGGVSFGDIHVTVGGGTDVETAANLAAAKVRRAVLDSASMKNAMRRGVLGGLHS